MKEILAFNYIFCRHIVCVLSVIFFQILIEGVFICVEPNGDLLITRYECIVFANYTERRHALEHQIQDLSKVLNS